MKRDKETGIGADPQDIQTFEHIKTSISSWDSTGDDLVKAARKLAEERDPQRNDLVKYPYRDVHDMLIAYALENYYKGAIETKLAKEGKTEDIGKLRSNRNHRLLQLAKDAGVSITHKQERALEHLSECALWRGRYPIPVSPQKIDGSMKYFKHGHCDTIIGHCLAIPLNETDELVTQAKMNLVGLKTMDKRNWE